MYIGTTNNMNHTRHNNCKKNYNKLKNNKVSIAIIIYNNCRLSLNCNVNSLRKRTKEKGTERLNEDNRRGSVALTGFMSSLERWMISRQYLGSWQPGNCSPFICSPVGQARGREKNTYKHNVTPELCPVQWAELLWMWDEQTRPDAGAKPSFTSKHDVRQNYVTVYRW